MARTARTSTGILRASFMDALAVLVAQGATPKKVQNFICHDDNSDAVAACTRDAFGGRRMGTILDAMVEVQNGKCFFCTVAFYSLQGESSPEAAGTVANAFLLVPSVLWADTDVSGYSAHESAYVPGNIVAACTLCTNDRDRASEAQGSPVCVDVDSLHPAQVSKILLTFPKGVKKGAINHDGAGIAKRRAIRVAQVGF